MRKITHLWRGRKQSHAMFTAHISQTLSGGVCFVVTDDLYYTYYPHFIHSIFANTERTALCNNHRISIHTIHRNGSNRP